MKKILTIVALALSLVGYCNEPDKVAVAYIEAMSKGNIDMAIGHVCQKNKPQVKAMSAIPGVKEQLIREGAGTTFKAVKTKKHGKYATVRIKSIKGKIVKTADFRLVKEGGVWKIELN